MIDKHRHAHKQQNTHLNAPSYHKPRRWGEKQQVWLNGHEAAAVSNVLVVTAMFNLSSEIALISGTLMRTVGPGFVSTTNTITAGYQDNSSKPHQMVTPSHLIPLQSPLHHIIILLSQLLVHFSWGFRAHIISKMFFVGIHLKKKQHFLFFPAGTLRTSGWFVHADLWTTALWSNNSQSSSRPATYHLPTHICQYTPIPLVQRLFSSWDNKLHSPTMDK